MKPVPTFNGMRCAGLSVLLLAVTAALAQVAPAAGSQANDKTVKAPPSAVLTTEWSKLAPAAQQALKPLATHWNSLDEAQKRKWLAISRNFNALPATEQAKLHSRMTEWIALSPQQRIQARLNFAETSKVPADEKMAKWQSYQTLSQEEKRKLAASASPQPSGAAAAVKPVAPRKLATSPNARPPRGTASGIPSALHQVDQKTLLPRPAASAPDVPEIPPEHP